MPWVLLLLKCSVCDAGEEGDMWGMEFAVCASCVNHTEKLISPADFWSLVILPGTGQSLTLCSLLKKKQLRVEEGEPCLIQLGKEKEKTPKWGMIKKKGFRHILYARFWANSGRIVTGSYTFLLWAGIHGNNYWELDSYTYTPTQVILWSLIS